MGWDRKELISVPTGKECLRGGKNGAKGKKGANGSAPMDRPWSWQRFAFRPGMGVRRHLITGGAGFIGSHLADRKSVV